MIDDKDLVRLSECCFIVHEVIKTAIQGENADDIDGSAREVLEDLERYVD